MPELWVYSLQLLGLFAVAFSGQLVARVAHGAIQKRRAAARGAASGDSGPNALADSADHWALTIKELAEVMGAADELAQAELAPGLLDADGAQAVSVGLVRRARQLVDFEADFRNKHRLEVSQLHETVDKCEHLLKEMVEGVSVYIGEPAAELVAAGADNAYEAEALDAERTELERLVHASKQQLSRLSREIEELRRNAMLDALTEVPNRRAFDAHLERLVNNCRHGRARLCVAMIDVDHFKKFNDAHGHAGGDVVLRAVAAALKSACREQAIVARYGGEEFALLLPGATFVEARAAAERALDAIAAAEARFEGQGFRVTASLGLAEWGRGETGDVLVHRADMALYAAKKAGRARGYGHDGRRCIPLAGVDEFVEQSAAGGAERRGAERRRFHVQQWVAPYFGGPLPEGDELIPVEFCDISLTGCSFVLRQPLSSRRVVVALGALPNLKYLAGDIVHCRRESGPEGVLFRVGCRFTGRLQ